MRQELSEHQIQTQIMNYLRYRGYEVMRLNSGSMRQRDSRGKMYIIRLLPVGTPDLMAFKTLYDNDGGHLGAQLYFVEVKRPGNKPTRMQLVRMEELQRKGAKCLVAYSVDDVEKVIQ